MKYNWQQKDWPEFKYDLNGLEDTLMAFAEEAGHTNGLLKGISEADRNEAVLQTLVAEAIKTSEIEGEYLSRQDVMSSINNNLGLVTPMHKVKDKMAQGVGELMVAVHNTFNAPLTEAMLFTWHKMLLGSVKGINAGEWRKHSDPMQVISGAVGKIIVHFEAPPSSIIPKEMKGFIKWFNDTAPGGKHEIKYASVRSAVSHLYFESIHPFEDGNGRIGRAIAEKALSQTLGRPVLLSLSQAIEGDKKSYYAALKKNQHDNEITDWVHYFTKVILDAQRQSTAMFDFLLMKTKFFDRHKNTLNERHLKAINKMMEAGPKGFEGGMTAKKYIGITKTSKPTATRDLQELVTLGAFTVEGAGRSTRYVLVI